MTTPTPPADDRVGCGLPMRRFLTDDRDVDDSELCIYAGGNGDWYVGVALAGCRPHRFVRLSASGGASTAHPGLVPAIHRAYQALGEEHHG